MYHAQDDPDCYPGTLVLKNLAGLRDQADLDVFEAASTLQRADEPLPRGRLSFSHYRAIHRHLFQDVYPFAGKLRTVRLAKGGSAFCYPEHIKREATILFETLRGKRGLKDLNADDFALAAADFLATLNAIHPFREGNGRSQTLFLALIAYQAGHALDLNKLDPEAFLAAMVISFKDDLKPLAQQIGMLIG